MPDRVREAANKIVGARRYAAYLSPGDKSQPYLAGRLEEGLNELARALDREVGTRYVCGMMDEVEFNQSREDAAEHPVYGPFDTYEEAEAVARTLSTDSHEATIMELRARPVLARSVEDEGMDTVGAAEPASDVSRGSDGPTPPPTVDDPDDFRVTHAMFDGADGYSEARGYNR